LQHLWRIRTHKEKRLRRLTLYFNGPPDTSSDFPAVVWNSKRPFLPSFSIYFPLGKNAAQPHPPAFIFKSQPFYAMTVKYGIGE
jgi:hypothetical protein